MLHASGGDSLNFFYDAKGKPSVVDFNGTRYGYVHNLQGDVIAIIDGSGTQVVEYTYDAWGKLLTKTGTMVTTLGTLNPFRYRGYVYDEETGLYYLRSRYYNPTWGRFVNGDVALGDTGQLFTHNIFAYCCNSCVSFRDTNGRKAVECSISAQKELTEQIIFEMESAGFKLPKGQYTVISVNTDKDSRTTVELYTTEPIYDVVLSTNLTITKAVIGKRTTYYTYTYTWKYDRNFRDWYEYKSVNSNWQEIKLAAGELDPMISLALFVTDDILVGNIVKLLPHTKDPLKKIYYKLGYSEVTEETK